MLSLNSSDLLTKQDIKNLIAEMKQEFSNLKQTNTQKFMEFKQELDKINIKLNDLQSSKGEQLEHAVLEILKYSNKLQNINPETFRKIKIRDPNGEVIQSGYKSDIDVLVENGNIYVIEIKVYARDESIHQLLINSKLYEHQSGRKVTQNILICLQISQDTLEYAQNMNIKVIYGELIP